MFASIPFIILGLIPLVYIFRGIRDRNKKDKWRNWGRHLSSFIVTVLVFGLLWIVVVGNYLNNPDNVYATYETVKLEEIRTTVQSPQVAKVYLQSSRSTERSDEADYYLVKVNGRKLRIDSFNTTVNYRQMESKMVVKSLRIKKSPISEMLHVVNAEQVTVYQVFIPISGVDLATNPSREDYAEYPTP